MHFPGCSPTQQDGTVAVFVPPPNSNRSATHLFETLCVVYGWRIRMVGILDTIFGSTDDKCLELPAGWEGFRCFVLGSRGVAVGVLGLTNCGGQWTAIVRRQAQVEPSGGPSPRTKTIVGMQASCADWLAGSYQLICFNERSWLLDATYGGVVDGLGQNRVLGFFGYIDPTNFKRILYPQLKSFNVYELLEFIYLTNI